MKYLIILIIFLCPVVQADDSFRWIDRDGNSIPEDATRKSNKGFGAWVLITPDKDWKEKWSTPAEEVPFFTVTDEVAKGEEIYILVLFSNPMSSNSGLIDIGCDITVKRPDGSISVSATDIDCAQGELLGDAYATRMTNLGVTYIAEEKDLPGKWEVYVDVVDRIRNARVSLLANYVVSE